MYKSLFENGFKGLADTPWSGVKGSVYRSVGIDHRSKPGVIKAHQKLTKNSGSTVTELCKVSVPVSDGSTLWFSSESGKIWREVSGVWSLVYTTVLAQWDLFTASLSGRYTSELFGSENQCPFIGDNGRRMIVLGVNDSLDNRVYSFYLDTPYEIATSVQGTEYDFSSQTSSMRALFVRSDGLKMWIADSNTTYQYTLATAWDVSSATYDSNSYNAGTQVGIGIRSIWFSSDGTKFFAKANTNPGVVYQYTLGTPWSVSTATYDSVSFTQAQGSTTTQGAAFSDDGTKLYITSLNGTGVQSSILQYALATPWSLASVTYEKAVKFFDSASLNPNSLSFADSGKKMYVAQSNIVSINRITGVVSTGGNSIVAYDMAASNESVTALDSSEHVAIFQATVVTDIPEIEAQPAIIWATKERILAVPVVNVASFAGTQVLGAFQVGNDTYHPMTVQNLQLFIGDTYEVARVTELGQYEKTTLFNVPETETITTAENFDTDIVFGTKRVNDCRILRWDTLSDSWSAEDEILETEVYQFIRDDNYLYAAIGDYGNLYFYNGEKMLLDTKIPGSWSPSKRAKVTAHAYLLGVPVFGLTNIAGNPTLQGIYSYGSYSKDYPKTMSLDYPISQGELESVSIGSILVKGGDMWVSWKHSTNAGVDKLDWTAKYANAYFETGMLTAPADRTSYKTTARFHAPYALLPDNTNVTFAYKRQFSGNYNTLTSMKDAQLAEVRSNSSVPKIASLQLRITLTVSGDNSPELEDVGYDIVKDQKGA